MSTDPAPQFPGRSLSAGDDGPNVLAIQHRLNQLGCGPITEDSKFGAETLTAVQRFQAQFEDSNHQPLTVDGSVGPMTWATLFGSPPEVRATAGAPLLAAVLQVAASQVGVLEQPLGSNSGPQVDQYLKSVNVPPGNAWCAAFVYWCFMQASQNLGVTNPAVCTAGALDLWNRAIKGGWFRVTAKEGGDSPGSVTPGMVFVLSTGGGHGHTGLVESISGVVLTTIEGNTNQGGSPEGIGVFRRVGRRISQIDQGFVDYSRLA